MQLSLSYGSLKYSFKPFHAFEASKKTSENTRTPSAFPTLVAFNARTHSFLAHCRYPKNVRAYVFIEKDPKRFHLLFSDFKEARISHLSNVKQRVTIKTFLKFNLENFCVGSLVFSTRPFLLVINLKYSHANKLKIIFRWIC